MANLENSVNEIRLLEDFAQKDTSIHRIHPLITFLITIIFIGIVASFDRYEVISILPFVLYPVIIFSVSRIPALAIFKRALIALPLILGIGIFAIIFDRNVVIFGTNIYYAGWFNFTSLIIRYSLIVTASLLMISILGIDKLSYAMRMIRIPKLLVIQMMLTYRYISVIGEQIIITVRAYKLRSFGEKGIHKKAWGSLMGQLILSTYERSQYIYRAMILRGFTGDYHPGKNQRIRLKDIAYLTLWISLFILARIFDIPTFIGSIIMGVIT